MFNIRFVEEWVAKIMNCVKSVRFTFSLNEQLVGKVTLQRGLRQRDPVSPFLFFFCSKRPSGLLKNAEEEDELEGIRFVEPGIRVSHLLFADDGMLFFKADARNI